MYSGRPGHTLNPEWSPRVDPMTTLCIRPGGGRFWWAHLAFTRINIQAIIQKKEIEGKR